MALPGFASRGTTFFSLGLRGGERSLGLPPRGTATVPRGFREGGEASSGLDLLCCWRFLFNCPAAGAARTGPRRTAMILLPFEVPLFLPAREKSSKTTYWSCLASSVTLTRNRAVAGFNSLGSCVHMQSCILDTLEAKQSLEKDSRPANVAGYWAAKEGGGSMMRDTMNGGLRCDFLSAEEKNTFFPDATRTVLARWVQRRMPDVNCRRR